MLRDCHAIHNTEGKNVGALTGPRGLKHHQERCADSRLAHRSLRQVRRGGTKILVARGEGGREEKKVSSSCLSLVSSQKKEKCRITWLHQSSKNSSKLQIISIAEGSKKKIPKKKKSINLRSSLPRSGQADDSFAKLYHPPGSSSPVVNSNRKT